jgi:GT2 family glycosyltransferase
MNVSILIVNWNTRAMLAQCLRSIQQWPPKGACEVIVVDNASSDGSPHMVSNQFPAVRLVENEKNVGFAAASNQAIRRAKGRYLVLLNSDTEVRPGALDTLVQFMDAHPRAGAAGAHLLNPDGSLQPSCHPMLTPDREFWRLLFLDRLWRRATYAMHKWDPIIPRQVEVIKGACLLLRREALDQVGLLDDSYFMYTEEVDLCYRLHQAGWELWWVPQAEVIHHKAQSTRQAAEDMYIQLYRSKVRFYRKYGGQCQAQRFKRLMKLAYGPRLAVAVLGSLLSTHLAAQARVYKQLLAQLPGM